MNVIPRESRRLLADAGRNLDHAMAASAPTDRFYFAHLSALRAAAAVVAMDRKPCRRRPTSVWVLLAKSNPELSEWCDAFAAGSRTRRSVDAGIPVNVSLDESNDLIRSAATFRDLVEGVLSGAALELVGV